MVEGNIKGSEQISADEVALYDRQIRLWGLDAQNRMRKSRSLIINLGGLSAEVLKNMVLAGVGSVAILDSKVVEPKDLGANFFLQEEHVGKPRAEAALPSLQKLNPRVSIELEVTKTIKDLDEAWYSQFNIVLATGLEYSDLCYINNITHKNKQALYVADLHGLYGYVFVDLVEHEFKIERSKPNIPTKVGPETKTRSIVSSVSKRDGENHIEVLTKLEKYKSIGQVIQDSTEGKFGSQFKGRKLLKISPLLPAILAYWARDDGKLDFESFKPLVIEKTQELGLPVGIISDEFLSAFVSGIAAELSPVAAVMGGVVAQDILNVLGKKEQPIQNLFLFDGNTNEGPIYSL